MATLAKSPVVSSKKALHTYHADAQVLSGQLEQPVNEAIPVQAQVVLPHNGMLQYAAATPDQLPQQLKGIISFRSGYSQVAGHESTKAAHGFTTVATSAIEGLNVLDVLTADRVVAQITTHHPSYPEEGQVPSVAFLGTRFDNLRIGGHHVEIERHLDILGPKPNGDKSYFDDKGVLGRISDQYAVINKVKGLPMWASQQFRWKKPEVQRQNGTQRLVMQCSVIKRITGAPGISFGHVIDLPHFGKIFLGELIINRGARQADDGEVHSCDARPVHVQSDHDPPGARLHRPREYNCREGRLERRRQGLERTERRSPPRFRT